MGPAAIIGRFGGLWASSLRPVFGLRLFQALVVLDLALIGLHLLRAVEINLGLSLRALASDAFAIDLERGLAEHVQALKYVAAIIVLAARWTYRRSPLDLALVGVFFLIALDDFMGVHEQAGAWLEALAARDFSGPYMLFEAGAMAVLALVLCTIAYWGMRASSVDDMDAAMCIAVPLAVFAFCAVTVDMLHAVAQDAFPGANFLLTIAEDGGEMLAISFALALIVQQSLAPSRAAAPTLGLEPMRQSSASALARNQPAE